MMYDHNEVSKNEITLQIAYGTTENSPVTFMSLPDDPIEKRVATIGRPHPHVEVIVKCNELY